MLDAISDFWKPSKKTEAEAPLDIQALKIGASIGFGFIPQTMLSGQRATISAINTYEFSGDRLTSYVLDAHGNTSISLIIADGEGEKYIALSRRIPVSERLGLFDQKDLLAVMDQTEQKKLHMKSQTGEWEEWVVDSYKKAIHGLKGKLISGDFRSLSSLPDATDAKEFNYTLLVSNNNEYALEIEQYNDNRMEVYATVYRRISDIGEIKPAVPEFSLAEKPEAENKPKPVASTARELSALKPANDMGIKKPLDAPKAATQTKEEKPANAVLDEGTVTTKPLKLEDLPIAERHAPHLELYAPLKDVPAFEPVKAVVPTIQTLEQATPASLPKLSSAKEESAAIEPVKTSKQDEVFFAKPIETQAASLAQAATPPANNTSSHLREEAEEEVSVITQEEIQETSAALAVAEFSDTQESEPQASTKENDMATYTAFNKAEIPASDIRSARAIPGQTPDVENDSVECELRAANRIIEEAIRNEMRMSDVVRRIIALPVAQQEQVEIPVMLTDSDYHLLAIRYGIPAADRTAIKAKIIEEINDFSGSK